MKILLLLPDGVGVRNFLYTDFIDLALSFGHEVSLWSDEAILNLINNERIKKYYLPKDKSTSPFTDIKRRAWSRGLLEYQSKYFNNPVYLRYIFHNEVTSAKSLIRNIVEKLVLVTHRGRKRLNKLRNQYLEEYRKSTYFTLCLEQIKIIQPDVVFCTHQRSSLAISPLLAAQTIGVKTACFIYSWDNMPKANLYVKSDYYFVWSSHMKEEILMYYPELKAKNINITGTPQFMPYFKNSNRISRSEFADRYNLPMGHKWICFSGDDITTSPYDQIYLRHLGESVLKWNMVHDEKLHIVFRRCPTDFSIRYDDVLSDFDNIITEIRPAWNSLNKSGGWDKIVPDKEDNVLLVNTVLHCECVINVGSTMAHDFSLYGKPCIYIKYNIDNKNLTWNVNRIYDNIHFQTMLDLEPVIWIENKTQWIEKLYIALYESENAVVDSKKWHKKVALYPLEKANERILQSLGNLVK